MLLVQKYLLNHSLDDLYQEHAIDVSFSKDKTKMSLNYNMINAKSNDELACQCRGLILSLPNGCAFSNDIVIGETIIVACPFYRFFNFGQGEASEINFDDPGTKVQKKMDGTCTFLSFDHFKNDWFVSTRSCPEADIPLEDGKYTFATLFEEGVRNTLNISFEELKNQLDKNITYIFELTSYWNRIVCIYKETSITLLGARDISTLKEIPLHDIKLMCPKVEEFALRSIQDIVNWVSDQKPTEHEGVVVVDKDFNRIKIKNPSYVLLHRKKDILVRSDRNALEAVLLGQEDDIIPLLPEAMVQKLVEYKSKVSDFIKNYDKAYDQIINSLPENFSQKDFALKLKELKIWEAPLFSRRKGQVSGTHDWIFSSRKMGTWTSQFLDTFLSYL